LRARPVCPCGTSQKPTSGRCRSRAACRGRRATGGRSSPRGWGSSGVAGFRHRTGSHSGRSRSSAASCTGRASRERGEWRHPRLRRRWRTTACCRRRSSSSSSDRRHGISRWSSVVSRRRAVQARRLCAAIAVGAAALVAATMPQQAATRPARAACGVELWSLKTLSDPQRSLVRPRQKRSPHGSARPPLQANPPRAPPPTPPPAGHERARAQPGPNHHEGKRTNPRRRIRPPSSGRRTRDGASSASHLPAARFDSRCSQEQEGKDAALTTTAESFLRVYLERFTRAREHQLAPNLSRVASAGKVPNSKSAPRRQLAQPARDSAR
jgi:hypothetical protein